MIACVISVMELSEMRSKDNALSSISWHVACSLADLLVASTIALHELAIDETASTAKLLKTCMKSIHGQPVEHGVLAIRIACAFSIA